MAIVPVATKSSTFIILAPNITNVVRLPLYRTASYAIACFAQWSHSHNVRKEIHGYFHLTSCFLVGPFLLPDLQGT